MNKPKPSRPEQIRVTKLNKNKARPYTILVQYKNGETNMSNVSAYGLAKKLINLGIGFLK